MPIETVGDLRALLSKLPDDMPVVVYSERMESTVDFDCSVHTVQGDRDVSNEFVIFTEN